MWTSDIHCMASTVHGDHISGIKVWAYSKTTLSKNSMIGLRTKIVKMNITLPHEQMHPDAVPFSTKTISPGRTLGSGQSQSPGQSGRAVWSSATKFEHFRGSYDNSYRKRGGWGGSNMLIIIQHFYYRISRTQIYRTKFCVKQTKGCRARASQTFGTRSCLSSCVNDTIIH